MRRGVNQYSWAGVPPIGPITAKYSKATPQRMENLLTDNNNNFNIENNNNNGKLSLNRFNPLPPISKIPGLNPDSDVIAAAEKKVFRTFKIHETDSSYVKLAKQGGHKNLLEYKEFDKENLNLKTSGKQTKNGRVKRPNWLEHEEKKQNKADKSPLYEDESNNNNISMYNNNNNNNNSKYGNGGAGRSIIEIKKQAKMLKERPDLLPVDNTEILKHLNAPKQQILPKINNKYRFASKFVRVAGR